MKKVFKVGCLGLIGIFLLLLAIGIVFGESDSETVSETVVEPESKEKATALEEPAAPTIAAIGESLKVGDVVFKVNEVHTTDKITDGGGYITYEPDSEGATFLVLNATVENAGKEAITTDSSFFKLKNGDVEYSPTTIFTTDTKFFSFDGINPGLSMTGNVLFEIPVETTGLNLQVQTGIFGTEQGEIKIN